MSQNSNSMLFVFAPIWMASNFRVAVTCKSKKTPTLKHLAPKKKFKKCTKWNRGTILRSLSFICSDFRSSTRAQIYSSRFSCLRHNRCLRGFRVTTTFCTVLRMNSGHYLSGNHRSFSKACSRGWWLVSPLKVTWVSRVDKCQWPCHTALRFRIAMINRRAVGDVPPRISSWLAWTAQKQWDADVTLLSCGHSWICSGFLQ